LRSQAQVHALAINPVVYAELSFAFRRFEELEDAVRRLGLAYRELPRPALFLAGKAFARYRAGGGVRTGVLSDFFIGAHAAVDRLTLLTRDPRRYRGHFPTVPLVTPDTHPPTQPLSPRPNDSPALPAYTSARHLVRRAPRGRAAGGR
jgi:predicted nucleic acid-binding protein